MENLIEDLTEKLEDTKLEDGKQKKTLSESEILKICEGFSLDEINNLLDKLYIECIDLTEQYIRCKVEMEKRQNEGNLLIAKARYIQGGKTVSIAQLPTDESTEFNALVSTSIENSTESFCNEKIIIHKNPIDKNKGYLDPVKWFGVLVPRSLHFAKERYQLAIDLVIDAANVQKELLAVISHIEQMKKVKRLLKNKQ